MRVLSSISLVRTLVRTLYFYKNNHFVYKDTILCILDILLNAYATYPILKYPEYISF